MDSTRPVLKRVAGATLGAAKTAARLPRTLEERRRQRVARWLVVTVDRPLEDGDAGVHTQLRDSGAEVEIRPAPDGRGTEIAARPRGARRDEVRAALREAKQLLEVGEVLRVDPQPTGTRTATAASGLIGAVTRRAGKKGVL